MANFEFNNTDDVIDVRDVIERFEELETLLESHHAAQETTLSFEYALQDVVNFDGLEDEYHEFTQIKNLLGELCGCGGDEQWCGDWYPITLIRDSYFESAMDELVEDIGEIPKNLPSYLTVTIDYLALQQDYSPVNVDGTTYWYR